MITKLNPEALQALVLALNVDIRRLVRKVDELEEQAKRVTLVQEGLAVAQQGIMERLAFIESKVLGKL